MRSRIAIINQAGLILKFSSRNAGFVLPFVMFLAGSLIVGAAMLASMSGAGIFNAFNQMRSKQAREAAEVGVDVIMNTLNANTNRKLLVAAVPLNDWNKTESLSRLRNPCQAGQSPSNAALQFGNNRENAIGGDNHHVFVLKTITLRNPGRTATYISSADATGPGGTTGLSSGGYVDTGINLDLEAASPAGGFIEVVVEGRTYDGTGRLQSVARVTREFAVIPKCCGIGFSAGYGSDNRLCTPPALVLGLSGGGFNVSGTPSPAPSMRQTTGLLDSSASSTKPSSIYCITSGSSCGGNQSTIDGVPLQILGLTPPTPPAYPACSGGSCNIGYILNSTSLSGSDYIRVNASGTQVEICNAATNSNTSSYSREPALPASVSACSPSIDNYCLRETDPTGPVFYCRLSQLTVLDDTSGGSNASLASRKQNNTLWVDTTRGSIYLYLNQSWLNPWSFTNLAVNLTYSGGNYRDGQIQHLNCLDASGNIPGGFSGICGQNAKPRDLPRAMIYSDAAINLTVGDDGFLRDFLVYLPAGTANISYPSGAACDPPTPIIRAMLWLNSLNLTRGSNCTLTGYTNGSAMQFVVPPSGTMFSTSKATNPILYEWVARSSTFTSLF